MVSMGKRILAVCMAGIFAIGIVVSGGLCQEVKAEESTTEKIEVKELDLGEYETTMNPGDKQLLSVTTLPYDATDTSVSYASSNTAVATINSMGRITAIAIGTTVITVTCGGISESFELTVVDKEDDTVAVTDVEISDYENELEVDETLTLNATVLPSNATDATVSFTSSDESIATVNSSGVVKGISAGKVTIYVSAGDVTKKVKLKVVVGTDAISLNTDYVVLKVGGSKKITAEVSPSEAPQKVTYKSSDASVASVSSKGLIKAKGVGNTTVIVSNGYYSAAITVIVNMSQGSSITTTQEETEEASESDDYTQYSKTVTAEDYPVINSETLKYLYENKQIMLVVGDGYTITIDGEDIVNYENELSTDINLTSEDEDDMFVINEGNNLCGKITLTLDEVEGKYLYLYNESKEKYECVQTGDINEISITQPGNYLISDKKEFSDGRFVIAASGIGGSIVVILIGIYIAVKKRYWFW